MRDLKEAKGRTDVLQAACDLIADPDKVCMNKQHQVVQGAPAAPIDDVAGEPKAAEPAEPAPAEAAEAAVPSPGGHTDVADAQPAQPVVPAAAVEAVKSPERKRLKV